MAEPAERVIGPLSDLISLPALLRHVAGYFASSYLAAEALKQKILSSSEDRVRVRIRWHSGDPDARLIYGSPLGPPVAEEQATPELLKALCEAIGSGFGGLLRHEGGSRTAFCFASRRDAARFWPWPDDKQHMQGRRDPRGARTDYDWEAALIAAAAHVWSNGLPETQAILEEYIADWFGENGPEMTQIRSHIGPLYKALKQLG